MIHQSIPPEWQSARRILAIRLDNLGDVLLATPAIRAIKQSLPDASVTLLASPVGAQAGRLHPDVDDVIVYESPQMDPWRRLQQDSQREQRMIELLKERAFDGAIIFTSFRQSSLPAAYLCYLADIPLRHAASIDGPGSLLTSRHQHPERMMHEVERGLDLVGAVGLRADKNDLVLRVTDEARKSFEFRVLSSELGRAFDSKLETQNSARKTPLVVVHPGCSMPARTYPWKLYADVVDLLVDQLGATVALTGDVHERDLVDRIHGRVRPDLQSAVLPLAGELEFGEFCALIQTADLTVTNNTGPMHISAAVKTPVVALFALTNPPEQWHPWRVPHRLLFHDVPCRLCYSRICPYSHECLRTVTAAEVLHAATDLLEGDGGLLEREVGGDRPHVRAQPQLEPAMFEPKPARAVSGPAWYGGALGQDWKLGPDLDSVDVGWRLGAGWQLGSES
jgi:ADP-heptose:LPS heptosyltransferase